MQRSTTNGHVPLPDTAEGWMARLLAADCSTGERTAFEHWRAADPEHTLAFAEVEYLHESAAQLADDPLVRAATRAALRDKAPSRHRQLGWMLSAAAGLLAAVGLTTHFYGGFGSATTSTHYASTTTLKTIQLDDGTLMQLDAASAVTVRYDRSRRLIELGSGRVEFNVAADPDRPFEVRAGGTTIHDIGTIFQVSRDEQQVAISLLEGLVEISGEHAGQAWKRELEPAQEIHVSADGKAEPVKPLDMAAARAWPQGQLVFHQRQLGDLLIEANRYSSVQLRLGDASLASLRVSGTIQTGDPETLTKALERGWQLQATRTGPDEITLQRSSKAAN